MRSHKPKKMTAPKGRRGLNIGKKRAWAHQKREDGELRDQKKRKTQTSKPNEWRTRNDDANYRGEEHKGVNPLKKRRKGCRNRREKMKAVSRKENKDNSLSPRLNEQKSGNSKGSPNPGVGRGSGTGEGKGSSRG